MKVKSAIMTRKNRATGFNYNRILFFSFIALALIIAGCNTNANLGNNANANPAAYETKSTGSLEMGDVVVELAPVGIKNGKFEVQVTANTHSVDLSQFDLMQATTLAYENKNVKPLSAPKLNGHHSSGTIIFDIKEEINNFKITINEIPNIPDRIFEWPEIR